MHFFASRKTKQSTLHLTFGSATRCCCIICLSSSAALSTSAKRSSTVAKLAEMPDILGTVSATICYDAENRSVSECPPVLSSQCSGDSQIPDAGRPQWPGRSSGASAERTQLCKDQGSCCMIHQELCLLVIPKGSLQPNRSNRSLTGRWDLLDSSLMFSARFHNCFTTKCLVGHHDLQSGNLTSAARLHSEVVMF